MNKDITLEDLGYETTSEKIEKELIIQIENKLKKNKFVPKAHLEYLIKHLQIDINELQEQTEMLKMTLNGNYINTVETQIAVLIEENRNLQHQLQEKDKSINDAINYIDNYMYENYCYAGSEDRLKEILERGKNGK